MKDNGTCTTFTISESKKLNDKEKIRELKFDNNVLKHDIKELKKDRRFLLIGLIIVTIITIVEHFVY